MIETDSITIKESAQVLRKSESALPAIVVSRTGLEPVTC